VSGLLVVAHEGGRVRLYILGTEDRELTQHNIDADGKIGKGEGPASLNPSYDFLNSKTQRCLLFGALHSERPI
jgi:hypothetical protein